MKLLLATSIVTVASTKGASSFRPKGFSSAIRQVNNKSFLTSSSTSLSTMSKTEGWISIHSDKTKAELVKTSGIDWVATSQAGGVYRKMIEREGTEKVARATTIVKFDPNQEFPRHTHDGGEEFLVLDGVWRDDYGAFPKYSYVRNYIGSGHTPSIGEEGCTILVKLRQMSHNSNDEPEHKAWESWTPENSPGIAKQDLYASSLERTSVQLWPANSSIDITIPKNGAEIFVVDGKFSSHLGDHDEWSWCRVPNDTEGEIKFSVKTGSEPAYVWTKEAHLASDEVGMAKP